MLQYAIGDELLIALILTIIIVAMYYITLLLSHAKIIRLTIGEAALMAQFEGALIAMIVLIIAGLDMLAIYLFFIFLVFAVFLFDKKAKRWYYERQLRKADSSTLQKEFTDRR